MEIEIAKLLSIIGLLNLTLAVTLFPFWLKRYIPLESNISAISYLNCFGGGVFFGTCLLHLFPDVKEQMNVIFEHLGRSPNFPVTEFLFGFGFLLILLVEQIAHSCIEVDESSSEVEFCPVNNANITSYGSINFNASQPGPANTILNPSITISDSEGLDIPQNDSRSRDEENSSESLVLLHQDESSHVNISDLRSIMLLFALSVHSVFEGLAIGLQSTVLKEMQILGAVSIHKCVIAFTFGLNLANKKLKTWIAISSCLIFSFSSPFGILIGYGVLGFVKGLAMDIVSGILQGLAAGTFLYITFFEILPEGFLNTLNLQDRMGKVGGVVFGFSIVCALIYIFPD